MPSRCWCCVGEESVNTFVEERGERERERERGPVDIISTGYIIPYQNCSLTLFDG